MYRACLAAGAGLVLAAGAAHAQDPGAAPSFGSVDLSSGFSPDPFTVELQSGGPIDAQRALGGDCRGFIASAPDFSINYGAGETWPLILSVRAEADTALVVNDAAGQWRCDDDSGDGTNPSIRLSSPASGRYDIWVATYGSSSLEPATLYISELASQ